MAHIDNPLHSKIADDVRRPTRKFKLGRVQMTAGVQALIRSGHLDPLVYLRRHAAGDWGDLDEHDKAVNERSLRDDLQLFSMYQISPTLKVYVITEWNRSVTTLLLPSEY